MKRLPFLCRIGLHKWGRYWPLHSVEHLGTPAKPYMIWKRRCFRAIDGCRKFQTMHESKGQRPFEVIAVKLDKR